MTAKVKFPIVCDYRDAAVSFGISFGGPYPFMLMPDFLSKLVAYDKAGSELGPILRTAIKRWNDGGYPIEPGVHDELPIFEQKEVIVDNGYGQRVPVNIWATIQVTQQLFFGHIDVEHLSGFKDELSGGVITNAFTTGILDQEVVIESWEKIDKIDALPNRPSMVLVGLFGWSEDLEIEDAFGFNKGRESA